MANMRQSECYISHIIDAIEATCNIVYANWYVYMCIKHAQYKIIYTIPVDSRWDLCGRRSAALGLRAVARSGVECEWGIAYMHTISS